MGIDANIASKDEEGQERVRLSSAVAGGSENGALSGGLHELSRRTSCNPLIRSNTFDTAPGWRGHAAGEQGQTSNASDSDFSAAQADDSGSDFEEHTDDSDYSGNRKRKRQQQVSKLAAKFQKPRVDNAMRRKLRSVATEEPPTINGDSQPQSGNGEAHDNPLQETEDEDSSLTKEDIDDPTVIPERVVSDEQLEEEKAWLKTSWEFIAVLDFLAAFQDFLGMEQLQFSAEELESSMILSNGTSGLLVDVHLALIKGISVRSGVHVGNWTGSLAEKLRSYWRHGPLDGQPPFTSHRRFEAPTYALLPLQNRVSALRILCDLRLEKDDLHNVVETALHPPKKSKKERQAILKAKQNGSKLPPEEPLPTMETMRREPTAKDSSGLLYWYLDYHTTTGTRLYREVPSSLWKGKTKKDPQGPDWELIATSAESLTEVGERLKRSKKRADQDLADLILEDFVPELLERREADLRKQRAAAKRQAQLREIVPEGRSRRVRKTVDYSYDAFDATIRAALRDDDSEPARATRSAAFQDDRNDPEGELLQGRRRGRSVRDASPPSELPPFKRVRRAEGPSSTSPSSEPSRAGSLGVTPELTPEAEDLQEPASGANHHLEARQEDRNGVENREPLEEPPLDAASGAEMYSEVGEFNHQSWQGGPGGINGNHQQVHDNPDSHDQGGSHPTIPELCDLHPESKIPPYWQGQHQNDLYQASAQAPDAWHTAASNNHPPGQEYTIGHQFLQGQDASWRLEL